MNEIVGKIVVGGILVIAVFTVLAIYSDCRRRAQELNDEEAADTVFESVHSTFEDGHTEGYKEGRKEGYKEGYKEGHAEGYAAGYADAKEKYFDLRPARDTTDPPKLTLYRPGKN